MEKRTVEVPNITCGHCIKTIQRELGALEGVHAVSGDESTRRVTVEWDETATSWETIRSLMAEINYPPAE